MSPVIIGGCLVVGVVGVGPAAKRKKYTRSSLCAIFVKTMSTRKGYKGYFFQALT